MNCLVTGYLRALTIVASTFGFASEAFGQQEERIFSAEYFDAEIMNVTRAKSDANIIITVRIKGRGIGQDIRYGLYRRTESKEECGTLVDTEGADYTTASCLPFVDTRGAWSNQFNWSGGGALMVRNETYSVMTMRFQPNETSPGDPAATYNLTIPISTVACWWGLNGGLFGITPQCNNVTIGEQTIAFFNLKIG